MKKPIKLWANKILAKSNINFDKKDYYNHGYGDMAMAVKLIKSIITCFYTGINIKYIKRYGSWRIRQWMIDLCPNLMKINKLPFL